MTYYDRNKPADLKYILYCERFIIYFVNSKDQIIRTDMPFHPSDGWKFVGIVDRYGHKMPITIGECRYKNGKGKYHILDIDHGTRRIQGNRLMAIGASNG